MTNPFKKNFEIKKTEVKRKVENLSNLDQPLYTLEGNINKAVQEVHATPATRTIEELDTPLY